MDSIIKHLDSFDPISLSEMDEVTLMNRADTKFVFSITTLLKVIPELSNHYRVLEIKGVRLSAYQSLYFDTDDFRFIINIITEKQIETKFGTENTLILTYHFWKLNEKIIKAKQSKKEFRFKKINETLFGEHKAFVDEAVGEKLNCSQDIGTVFIELLLFIKEEKKD